MKALRRLILVLAALAIPLLCAGSATAATATLTNSSKIAIPGTGTFGPGSPYPSSVNVSAMVGPVTDVNVTLHKVAHTLPSEIRAVLVSPNGRAVSLMYANCGDDDIVDYTWIFDQQAVAPMPSGGAPCPGFVYRPAPSTFNSPMPGPAPSGPYGTSLDIFNGENPNGTWSLFVEDVSTGDVGEIKNGWSLTLTTGRVDAVVPGTGTSGAAGDYPLSETVGGIGVIKDVNVELSGVWHQRSDDLDILLVGPHGQSTVLMSDACGAAAAIGANWVWDDEAATPMPGSGGCNDGDYRPTDYTPGEGWFSPAPIPPYGETLAGFDGTNPNGTWSMYVLDDDDGAAGFFTNRFHVRIETRPEAATAFATGAMSVKEGRSRKLTIRRTADGALGAGEVGVETVPKSARNGDFTPIKQYVTFAPGQAKATIAVDARADRKSERDESYFVKLTAPDGDAALGKPARVKVTIPGEKGRARCAGMKATIVGTGKRDVIRGTRGDDVIAGLGGNDVIRGGRGNDTVCGAGGRDRLAGESGRDRLLGGGGDDRLDGGPQRDRCDGGPGRNRVRCERRLGRG